MTKLVTDVQMMFTFPIHAHQRPAKFSKQTLSISLQTKLQTKKTNSFRAALSVNPAKCPERSIDATSEGKVTRSGATPLAKAIDETNTTCTLSRAAVREVGSVAISYDNIGFVLRSAAHFE
jgi:hypothetical protein